MTSFKSVGKTRTQSAAEVISSSNTQIGIKTPVQFGDAGDIFAVNTSLKTQIADNLKNLIVTNWGERLGQYFFGANLRPLTTENTSRDDFEAEVIQRINSAVSTWMPFVSLNDFVLRIEYEEFVKTGVYKFLVTYSVPSIELDNQAIEVVIYYI